MDTTGLKELSAELLGGDDQFIIGELLLEGKVDDAKTFILSAIDIHFQEGAISFNEAADLYRRLAIDTELARCTRQQHALETMPVRRTSH